MKKSSRNIFVLIAASCFLTFGLIGEQANAAQTKNAAQPAPTPKAKKSAPANAKPSPKPTAVPQIIVTATAVTIRQLPAARSNRLTVVKLGKILPVAEKNAASYRVQYAEGKSGWISATYAKDFDAANREKIYREIADKYSKNKTMDFATAVEVAEFLKTAQASVRSNESQADLKFKRLRVLTAALQAIPIGKGEQFPYKNFLRASEKEVVYSEPSGKWYVRSDLFWELRSNYKELPIAEEIAWEAAQNSMPGECEGYINCNLYAVRATEAEYLNFYPNGKYSKKALENITSLFEILISNMNNKKVYTPLSDISERAEFNRFLTELRTIISKVSSLEKTKIIGQINQLGEGYK